jgi:hypothetical protein
MTSRERVARAIGFRCPDRIPLAKGPNADIAYVGYRPARDCAPAKPGMNEWGCVWTSLNASLGDQGQVCEHPLSDWGSFPSYRFPDPSAPGRFDHAAAEIERLHGKGQFVCASLGKGPMHLLDDLRGFEEYLTDLVTAPERVERLLDGIFGFLSGLVQAFGRLGADAVFLADDQAAQTGPLFSMDIWRQRLKPHYRRLFSLAHDAGCGVFMHTCGNLRQHLAELADAGVDVIDNKQPALWMECPDVDAVRGRIAFSTCLDIQSVMGTIQVGVIEAEVSRLIRRLSVPEGGFIGTWYHQPDLGIPPEKTDRMVQAFKAFRWRA